MEFLNLGNGLRSALAVVFAAGLIFLALRAPGAPADSAADMPVRDGWSRYELFEARPTGFSFELPTGYYGDSEIPADTGYTMFSARDLYSSEERQVKFVREKTDGSYCHLGYCDAEAEGRVTVAGVTWDFLGERQYCDAGECGAPRRYYRLTRGGYTYYAAFGGETREREILETLRFEE